MANNRNDFGLIEEDFSENQSENQDASRDEKPLIKVEIPLCPITQEALVSPDDVRGAPDGHVYKKGAIEEWVSLSATSPMNPDMKLTQGDLFVPVAFNDAMERATYKGEKCKRLIKKNKQLSQQLDQTQDALETVTQQLEEEKAKNQNLKNQFKLFKQNLKRKRDSTNDFGQKEKHPNQRRRLALSFQGS